MEAGTYSVKRSSTTGPALAACTEAAEPKIPLMTPEAVLPATLLTAPNPAPAMPRNGVISPTISFQVTSGLGLVKKVDTIVEVSPGPMVPALNRVLYKSLK